jgi:hypothetical protein
VPKTFNEIQMFIGLCAKIWGLGFETGCADQPSHKEHVYTIAVFSVRVIPLHILPSNSFLFAFLLLTCNQKFLKQLQSDVSFLVDKSVCSPIFLLLLDE